MIRKLFLLFLLGSLSACNNSARPSDAYAFEAPTEVFKTSKKLREISGLSLLNDSTLLTINDEKGTLFYLNKSTGKIRTKKHFGPKNDYEAVAQIGEISYILQSNGLLFRRSQGNTKTFDIGLPKAHEFEGLCPFKQQLLIGCKSCGDASIYSYNPNQTEQKSQLLFNINKKQRKQFVTENKTTHPDFELLKKGAKKKFLLSALAIQPGTENIYMLSAHSQLLLVLSPRFDIIDCIYLPESPFKQPEGITFDAQKNLYIASEGYRKRGRIFYFKYLK